MPASVSFLAHAVLEIQGAERLCIYLRSLTQWTELRFLFQSADSKPIALPTHPRPSSSLPSSLLVLASFRHISRFHSSSQFIS